MSIEQMKKAQSTMKELVIKGAKTASAKLLLQSITKLQNTVTEAQLKGATQQYLESLKTQGKEAIISDLIQCQALERQKVIEQIESLKKKSIADSEKEFALNDYRLKNWERRLYAMGESELERTAQAYIDNKNDLQSPEELDALTSALKDRGIEELTDTLRATMLERNYDSPFLRTEEGQLLTNQLKLLQHVDDGILLADDTGKTFGVTFDEIDELLSEDQDEEENNAI